MPEIFKLAILLIGIAIAFLYAVVPASFGAWNILLIKICASSCFVIVGGLNCYYNFSLFGCLMFVGLLFGMIADFVFGARNVYPKQKVLFFSLGATIFAVGHICYTFAFHTLDEIKFYWYIVAVIIAYLFYFAPKKFLNAHYGRLSSMIFSYSLIISFALFSAIAILISKPYELGRVLIMLAAVLFAISDFLLVLLSFTKKRNKNISFIHTMTYFIAQMLYAMAISHLG